MIMRFTHLLETLGHRTVAEIGATGNDDTRRFTASV
jgi:hypothetical protein